MSDLTTRRAEAIREATGVAWEIACHQAERERDQLQQRATGRAFASLCGLSLAGIGPAPRLCKADTGKVHGPTRQDRPAVIAERYGCPSCDAPAGQPCRLGDHPQRGIHMQRHRVAQRADWATLERTMPRQAFTGWSAAPDTRDTRMELQTF